MSKQQCGTGDAAIGGTNKIVIEEGALINSNGSECANSSVFFYTYPNYIKPDASYPIIIEVAEGVSPLDKLQEIIGRTNIEWPRVQVIIRCSDPIKIKKIIEQKLHSQKCEAPSECYITRPEDIKTFFTAIINEMYVKNGL
ncbi:MAG: hypothetical protein E7302_13515 [Butyrivibrio sp.]|nr:hypothetical protein [Butyrivibrio sp.]